MIVAVGGDGLFNEAVNGFFEHGAPVSPDAVLNLVPTTGGDIGLGRVHDVTAALQLAKVEWKYARKTGDAAVLDLTARFDAVQAASVGELELPREALQATRLLNDEKGKIKQLREGIRLEGLTANQWWWD